MRGVRVSPAVSVLNLGTERDNAHQLVVTNEATGQHFSADRATASFLEALRQSGDLGFACIQARIAPAYGAALAQQFAQRGLISGLAIEADRQGPKGPIEGKLISFKADLADASGLARRLSWLGSVMFTYPLALIWGALLLFAIATYLENGDKVATSLAQLGTLEPGALIGFVLLFILVKAVHELGHILAYRTMCLRENLDPGPIRVGIMVFAATPFPFTDVTGAWRISSSRRRAMIGAAGVYFETFTVALLTLAWARLDLGMMEPIILQVAVVAGALTLLFNLNPAVKLDGYYILTDLFRQPNLTGRASRSARAFVGRLLGADLPRPKRFELAYWLISYLYRWTIFAGVFWLAYRFDPRLATVIAVVAGMLLIIRPILATVRPLMKKLSILRLGAAALVLAGLVALSFVPFRARLLAEGQLLSFETEYLFPPEAVRLLETEEREGIGFAQPSLLQDQLALRTRLSVLENLSRRSGLNAVELAALSSDQAAVEDQLADIAVRLARLSPALPEGGTVTAISSDRFLGQWVSTGLSEPLAAVSVPTQSKLRIKITQNRLDDALGRSLQVRIVGAPECQFGAKLLTPWQDAVARDGVITVDANPGGELPDCAASLRNGAAIVARFPLPPRSFVERLRQRVARLLQERLPFEREA